jgi:hypothetical protein
MRPFYGMGHTPAKHSDSLIAFAMAGDEKPQIVTDIRMSGGADPAWFHCPKRGNGGLAERLRQAARAARLRKMPRYANFDTPHNR